MKYDYAKLNGRIVEKCNTQAVFAKKMGISEATISKKLNNNAEWRQREIQKAAMILELTETEIPVYFFTSELTHTKV